MKNAIKRALIGIAISVTVTQFITIIVSVCIGDGKFYPYYPILERKYGGSLNATLVQTGWSVIYGIVFGISTFIFEKDRWSLIRQTVTHFILITVSCLLGGWLCYWYPHSTKGVLIALAQYVFTYVVIWICVFMKYRNDVKKINESK